MIKTISRSIKGILEPNQVKNKIHSYLTVNLIILVSLSLLQSFTPLQWLLKAPISDLKVWYPNYYTFAYLFLKSLYFLNTFILLLSFILIQRYLLFSWWKLLPVFMISVVLGYFCFNLLWIVLVLLLISFLFFYNTNTLTILPIEKREKRDSWWIIGFIALAFIIRLIWILNTDNSGNGDAGMRLFGEKRWIDIILSDSNVNIPIVYYLMPSKDWLPLHYYLMGIWSGIIYEWQYSPRILTAIFGALSCIPLYRLSLLKFNRKTAIIASIILVFYGYHIFISSLTLSEVFYIFFILYAYLLIEKWFLSVDDRQLYGLAFILLCLCWLRYEGWFFSFIIVVLLPFIKRIKQWKTYLIFCGIVLSATLFIMLCEIGYGVHPLRGILYSDVEVRIALKNSPVSILQLIGEYKNSYIYFSFLGIILYLSYNLKKQNYRWFLVQVLYLFPLLPFIFKLSNGTLTAQARYMTLYMVPLIPFVAFLLHQLTAKISHLKTIIIITFFILTTNRSFIQSIKNGNLLLTYQLGFHNSARFIKQLNKGNIYIDTEEQWGEFNWGVESNQYFFKKHSLPIVLDKGNLLLLESDKSIYGIYNFDSFNKLYDEGELDYIVLFPNRELSNYLKDKMLNNLYRGKHLKKVFEKDGYIVWEVYKD